MQDPPSKRTRRSGLDDAGAAEPVKQLCAELEARRCVGGKRGHGIFARVDLDAGWMLMDHAICVPNQAGAPARRLPNFEVVDELMELLVTDDSYCDLVSGVWQMSHVPRHLDAQETSEADLPEWATRLQMPVARYNLLAAQLQSQIARDEHGTGLILLPSIRLANHACEPTTELGYAPDMDTSCPCGHGQYVLRALHDVRAGAELTFSYIGSQLLEATHLDERRELLQRRWGFHCECHLCTAQEAERKDEGRNRTAKS